MLAAFLIIFIQYFGFKHNLFVNILASNLQRLKESLVEKLPGWVFPVSGAESMKRAGKDWASFLVWNTFACGSLLLTQIVPPQGCIWPKFHLHETPAEHPSAFLLSLKKSDNYFTSPKMLSSSFMFFFFIIIVFFQ